MEEVTLTFIDILALASGTIGMLASLIFLFVNKTKKRPKIFLTIIIFTISYGVIIASFLHSRLILLWPWSYRTALPFVFLLGPATYFYITSSLIQPLVFPRKFFLHCIPAVLSVINFIPYYLLSRAQKVALIHRKYTEKKNLLFGEQDSVISANVVFMIAAFTGLIYIFRSAQILYRNRHEIQSEKPNPMIWYIVLCTAVVGIFVLIAIYSAIPTDLAYSKFNFGISLIIFLLLIYLYTQPEILYGALAEKIESGTVKENTTLIEDPIELNTEESILSQEQVDSYIKLIERCLSDTKPFLQREFKLQAFAELTKIPRHHLSWIINNVYKMNFNDFINHYRLEHIRKNYSEEAYDRMTFEGIAYEAGFNSRTTFSNAVKKQFDLTPTEFFNAIKSNTEPLETDGVQLRKYHG